MSSNCSVRLLPVARRQVEQVAEEIERLARIQIPVEIGFLRQVADARLGGHVPGRMAEDLDVPLGRDTAGPAAS